MDWYSGNISEAIQEAKVKQTLFVVVIHGPPDDPASQGLFSHVQNPSFVTSLGGIPPVAIKLLSGSNVCKQFSQLYPVVLVPSIYFIDSQDGVNLEVTGGPDRKLDDLVASAKKALEAFQAKRSVLSPRAERVGNAQRAMGELAQGQEERADGEDVSLKERVERAKRILAEKQARKQQEEEENEKTKEKERRDLGRNLQENKRRQEEEALKQAAMERKRDREEEKEARERVKRQIEQDRRERAEKYSKEKQDEAKRREEKEKEELKKRAEQAREAAMLNSTVARIQFRLPDGRAQTKHFQPDDQLQVLYDFVNAEMKSGFSAFTLSTTFPSRQLDKESKSSTLRSLELVPTATVLILPAASMQIAPDTGSFINFIWLLLSPLTMLWGILTDFFAGSSQSNSSARPNQGSTPANRVGRIRQSEADDDENSTYNGNSTQQM